MNFKFLIFAFLTVPIFSTNCMQQPDFDAIETQLQGDKAKMRGKCQRGALAMQQLLANTPIDKEALNAEFDMLLQQPQQNQNFFQNVQPQNSDSSEKDKSPLTSPRKK